MLLNVIKNYLSTIEQSIELDSDLKLIRSNIGQLIKESGLTNKYLMGVLSISRNAIQQKLSGKRGWKNSELLLVLREIFKELQKAP
jgi:hypothetical protein